MEKNSQEKDTPALPIPHYVCTGGCGFVSETPGKCPSIGCYRSRNPLTQCCCEDEKHGNLLTLNATSISH